MRLDKAVSLTGVSRSQARAIIAAGRVRVSGIVSKDAGLICDMSEVSVDGAQINSQSEIYIMMNKPSGVITATTDPREKTVCDLLYDNIARRVGPVGRLDKDVTGLVILTSNGQLAHRLISPKRDVEKTYIAEIEGNLSDGDIALLAGGVSFKDFTAKPAKAEMINEGVAKITVTEGKFHEVKKLLAKVNHPVIKLKRVSLAGVELDESLDLGQYRDMTNIEIDMLIAASGLER